MGLLENIPEFETLVKRSHNGATATDPANYLLAAGLLRLGGELHERLREIERIVQENKLALDALERRMERLEHK
jgi:hypothetical protein